MFQAGFNKSPTFLVSGGGAAITLNVTGHTWAEMIDALDITHTGTGGVQALLAGIFRGDGNIKGNVDAAILPSTFFIRAGFNGLFGIPLGSPTPFVVPAMIVKVNYQSLVEGKVEFNFDIKLNALAGNYTYPS